MTTQSIAYESARPSLQVLYYDGKLTHMEEIVGSVSIKGDVAKAMRECSVDFKNTEDGRKRLVNIANGKEIRILVGKDEIFRGVIFQFDRNADGDESLTAYDTNVYLTKNNVNIKYVDKTATEIIRDLCGKFGVKTGSIANTSHKIPRFIMRGKSIYDVFITALTMTQKVTGKRYMLRNNKSKLELVEVRPASKWLRYESGKNLLDASFSESIEDVRTQVEYSGGDEKNPVSTTVSKNTAKYGVMQETEHNSDANASALPALANALLDELSSPDTEMSVKVLGMPDIISGTAVIAKDGLAGLSGNYFVLSDNHSFDANGVHTMDLTLSKTLDLPVMEYEPPDEGDSDSGSSAEYDVEYTKGWVATAYDPTLGGINAFGDGRHTASSTRWAYNRTIAVDPSVIPHGSVVAIRVPSMKKYNGLYLAEDSGGAIKGKRVDILIQGKSATSTFGRRNIEVAILEKGKGAADARAKVKNWSAIKKKWNTKKEQRAINSEAKGKAKDIVKYGMSFIGRITYLFGGKNVRYGGSADCSGFTYHVYKKYGIDIGHGTSTQLTKGRSVDKKDAIPGDLVFFKGTYRPGVSHVGIVTRKGYCVSLASKPSNCKEHSYTTGYWGKHYMSIRRVL